MDIVKHERWLAQINEFEIILESIGADAESAANKSVAYSLKCKSVSQEARLISRALEGLKENLRLVAAAELLIDMVEETAEVKVLTQIYGKGLFSEEVINF